MRSHSPGGKFLRALAKDRSGNTLVIAAASLLPMTALIGGGVDVSRAYMAKTQLQSACDAGVLAGRRAMSKTGTYGTTEKAKASSMFTFNFNPTSFDATNVSYVTHDNDDGQVLGTATATIPTLVMKVFDMNTVDLSVDCMAELQIGNADIMFVLDTTGSMANSISYGDPAKIDGLRSAVRDFHKTINQAVNDNRTRIRYGFVPYSMTVNAKGLLTGGSMPYSYFTDQTQYQTRIPYFGKTTYVAETPVEVGSGTEVYSTKISQTNCNKYGAYNYPTSGVNPVKTGGAPNPLYVTEYNYVSWTNVTGSGNNKVGTCTRRWVKTRTDYETWFGFSYWIYQDESLDTANFKNFSSVPIATSVTSALVSTQGDYDLVTLAKMQAGTAPNGVKATGVSVSSYTWNGCLEERDTVQETDFDPIPDDAYDLDLDLVPSSSQTRWHPMWNNVEYSRSNYDGQYYYYNSSDGKYYNYSNYSGNQVSPPSNSSGSCPSEMMLFRTVELADDPNDVPAWLNTFLNNLVATGNTYHDIGMTWGGRLTSATGLFADNVNLDADKINVSKHIIFMTDGIMEPTASGYSAYGIENLDSRIAPRYYANTITSRHNARFSAQCEAIKAQGTTIWVVAFGTSMTTELQNCASNGRAYYSSNTEQLRNTFKFIAAQVADLRLGE
ncbi:TadE/TadG family type IV pilus assembly protein [Altererythrobacter fulvus]|uniref:TadE/TadG family type IV pilus assembly protein n=1 Tax=Caenibius fulvus TaxID=2126012 RepID=UPI003019CFFA